MSQQIKNEKFKKLWTEIIPSYAILILWIIFFIRADWNNDLQVEKENITTNINDTTWINFDTWSKWTWMIESWAMIEIEIPNNPRELLDYQIEYWTWWEDYIVATPTPEQPKINAKTSAENNEKMHKYLRNNRIIFDIDTTRQWYIMFITQKPIKNITNIFFGLDWTTIGRLDKKGVDRVITEHENEFLYPLDHIDLIWNNNYRFTAETTWKEKLSINAVVWEDNNKIEKIIIFFR